MNPEYVSIVNEIIVFLFGFFSCIRVITRNLDQCNCDDWDLSQLPSTIKTDIIQLNMKLSIGFTNEKSFIQLLTPNVTQLMFRKSIVTDAMLRCIGERCEYLHELRIFDSKDKITKSHVTSSGILNCIKGLKRVKALQIADSEEVNDKTVEMISQCCPHLQSLWLNDCRNVTDQSSTFLKSMTLNDLNLANTSVRIYLFYLIADNEISDVFFLSPLQITNNWLFQLVDSTLMNSLRDISLKNCNVSHEGLRNLNWKRLENINIIGVSIRGKYEHSLPFDSFMELANRKYFFELYFFF